MDQKHFDELTANLQDTAAFTLGDTSRARVIDFNAASLKAGLEDAVAFISGDTSRGRVIVRER